MKENADPDRDFQYDAFLSYAARTDYNKARDIELFLEAFHKTLGSNHALVRQLQICRDGSDFRLLAKRNDASKALSDPIWAVLRGELQKSRYLLVLCSPSAATSSWVEAETKWFIQNRGPDWVLPAVTDASDPISKPEECFPLSVRAAAIHQSRIWYDLRGLSAARPKTGYKNHEDELVRLAGDLLEWDVSRNGPLGAVWQREQRRRSRHQRIIAAAIVVALLTLGGLAVWRSRVASAEAQRVESQRLASRALSLIESNPEQGLRLAVQAVEVSPTEQAENSLRQTLLAFRLRKSVSIPKLEHLIALSPDGESVLTAGPNSTSLFALNTTQGMQIERRWVQQIGFSRAIFSKNGKFVAVAHSNSEVLILETVSGRQVKSISNVMPLALDSTGNLFITASDEGAEVRNATNPQLAMKLRVPPGTATNPVVAGGRPLSAAFNEYDELIVTTDDAGFSRIWDTKTGALKQTLSGHSSSVLYAEFSSFGEMVVTASQDGTARLWNTRGELLYELKGHTASVIHACFSRDSTFLVTSSTDGTARVWVTTTGEFIALLGPHGLPVERAAFTHDGKSVVTIGEDGPVRLWEANSGLSALTLSGHDEDFTGAAFSKSGKFIVTSSRNGKIRIWESGTGRELAELQAHSGICWMAKFSPNDELVATAGEDSAARLWAWQTTQLVKEFKGHERSVFSVDFSPDSEHLLTASADGTVRIWNVRSGALETTLKTSGSVAAAAYSPDGATVVTADSDKTAKVWDVKSGAKIITSGEHSSALTRASFSSNGKLIVTSSLDNTARIWDGTTGQSLGELRTHSFPIYDAEFSPNNKCIVTAGENGLGIVWETSTQRFLSALRAHEGFVSTAQFSPDGYYIVTASEDGTAQIYEYEICLPLPDVLEVAKRRLEIVSNGSLKKPQ